MSRCGQWFILFSFASELLLMATALGTPEGSTCFDLLYMGLSAGRISKTIVWEESYWVPALDLLTQLKWDLNQRWYSSIGIHNYWFINDNQIVADNQRWQLGFGYHL